MICCCLSFSDWNPSTGLYHTDNTIYNEIKVDADQVHSDHASAADDFVCKICHTYLVGCGPRLTVCNHLFCGDCLEHWFDVHPALRSWAQVAKTAATTELRQVPCPVCKTPLAENRDIVQLDKSMTTGSANMWKTLTKIKICNKMLLLLTFVVVDLCCC